MIHADGPHTRWWRETEVLLVVALVIPVFFLQLTDLNLRGEETRRALVATEMIRTGDWVVPRQQGELYVSRPPLGGWFIALAGLARGTVDVAAIRLPSVIAVLMTSVLLYAAGRNFLSRTGALAAAVAYPTMFQVLELGRLGESEGVFTFFVAASLLLWYWGDTRGWPRTTMWVAGYSLAALSGLTKGLQGPFYFAAPVFCYLIVTRRWRELFRLPHVIGMGVFFLITASWEIPYLLRAGREAGLAIWIDQVTDHVTQIETSALLKHVAVYPLEVFACTLPWSPVLVQFLNPKFRESLRRDGAPIGFFAICLLTTFPSVWLTPHAEVRYFMPLFPIVAVLCGMVVDQCSRAGEATWMNRGWRQFVAGFALVAAITGVVVAACPIINRPWAFDVNDDQRMGIVFANFAAVVAVMLVSAAVGDITRSARRCVMGVAIFTASAFCLTAVEGASRSQPDIRFRTAAILSRIPRDAQLVSLGRIDHAFVYYYGESIPALPWPSEFTSEETHIDSTPVEYFCFERHSHRDDEVPFAWEKIGELNIANSTTPHPQDAVVFGRRLRDTPLAAH